MKEISVRGMSERDLEMGRNEIEILRNCHHDNVVGYIDDFYENSKFLIVMEFCDGGDLASFIQRQRRHLPEDHVMRWFRQMISGIHYIHELNILHRDLKPANIFLTSGQQLKIGDFGISKSLDQTRDMAQTYCGTPVYMAPEVVGGVPYNHKADIWSLGCILYELAALKLAFCGSNFLHLISKGQYDRRPLEQHFSSSLSRLINKLLTPNPRDRPAAGDIIKASNKPRLFPKKKGGEDFKRCVSKKIASG